MSNTFNIAKRSSKVAFYKTDESDNYVRMRGFKSLETSKNAEESESKYVDEDSKRTFVTGYNTSISYEFDLISEDAVHEDIVDITDNERIGEDAVRSIMVVDIATKSARVRNFTVVPDSEGGDENNYTYSGTFKANGELKQGKATVDADGLTATFTEASVE